MLEYHQQKSDDHLFPKAHGPAFQEFEFGTAITHHVIVQLNANHLIVKTRFRTWETSIANVRYLYVYRIPGRYGTFSPDGPSQVVVTYVTSMGEPKVIKFTAIERSPFFHQFVECFRSIKPSIDLRHLSPREAFKRMQIPDPLLRQYVLKCAFLYALCALPAIPHYVHGLDSRHKTMTPAQLVFLSVFDTRNVTVLAKRLDVYADPRGQAVLCSAFPLVDKTSGPNDLVSLVAGSDCSRTQQKDKLAGQGAYRGVIRDVLWEGLKPGEREWMEKRGVKFARKVKRLDLNADPKHELQLAYMWSGLPLLGVFLGWCQLRWSRLRES